MSKKFHLSAIYHSDCGNRAVIVVPQSTDITLADALFVAYSKDGEPKYSIVFQTFGVTINEPELEEAIKQYLDTSIISYRGIELMGVVK